MKNTPISKANTYAIADRKRKAKHSGVAIVTELGVKEAKDWVDDVEK